MSSVAVHCTSKLYYSNSRNPNNINPSSNPSGSIELRIKERYLLTCQLNEGVNFVLEDVSSSEFCFVLNIPLIFSTPLSRTLHIKDMVSRLNLDPYVCEFVRVEISDIVAETLAESKGNEEFKKLLAVQVTKVELIGTEETARFFEKLSE